MCAIPCRAKDEVSPLMRSHDNGLCWCCGDTTVFSGDHPFECEFCGSCFRDDGTLRGHKRIHTGEKPYECNGCGKRFSLKHQLETHYRVHTGEVPETRTHSNMQESSVFGGCYSTSLKFKKDKAADIVYFFMVNKSNKSYQQ